MGPACSRVLFPGDTFVTRDGVGRPDGAGLTVVLVFSACAAVGLVTAAVGIAAGRVSGDVWVAFSGSGGGATGAAGAIGGAAVAAAAAAGTGVG